MSTQEKAKEKIEVKVDSGCCSSGLTKEQELKKAEEAKLAATQTEAEKAKKHSGGCCGG